MQNTPFGSCTLISEQKLSSSSDICINTSIGDCTDDLSSGRGNYSEPSQPLLRGEFLSRRARERDDTHSHKLNQVYNF